MKYSKKEYEELFGVVRKVRDRLGKEVSAEEVEKVAFVLEKVRGGVGYGAVEYVDEEEEIEGTEGVEKVEEVVEKKSMRGLKRTASEEKGGKASTSQKRARKG